MAKIRVMDSRLANMIAAGEVIERPSSVIKELVENSIDASSKHIEVKIYEAGRKKIIVKDDGDGMDKEDSITAFKRHASSKILDEYQLFKIKTMGFRGEALPSIAAVSKVTLLTSTGEGVGTKIEIEDEKMNVEAYSLLKGTTFIVEELFYNTPVRLKYLKTDVTEVASCLEIMQRLALAHPDIAFDFYIDEKLSFSTTGRGDLLEVIARLYGSDTAKKMVKVETETLEFNITGYIAKPELTRSTRYYMITNLNKRNVYLPQVQKAIINGYSDYIFNSKYPFVILDIKVDHSLVDVNVHPSKKEVRLSNDKVLSFAVENLIKTKLKELNAVHNVTLPHKEVETVNLFKDSSSESEDISFHRPIKEGINNYIETPVVSLDILDLDEDIYIESKKEEVQQEIKVEEKSIPYFNVIGQIHNTYIVLEGENGFYLVDQHAANERINYEKFDKILNNKIEVCSPLFPIVINLSPSDAVRLSEDKVNILKEIGLEIESFGFNAIKVSSIPLFVKESCEENYIEELIQQVIKEDKIDLHSLRKHVISSMACKASIKANDSLSIVEMNDLVKTLFECDNPTCCPHGRPTIIHFTNYDVEKMFKRSGI